MSTHVSSRVWADCGQTGERLLLMLALADYANDEGICWPSQVSLAARTRCSERGIQKMIDALAKIGEIEILRLGGGRGISAKYRLSQYLPEGGARRGKGERGSEKGEHETGNAKRGMPEEKDERGSEKDEPQGRKGEPETGNAKRGIPEEKDERGSEKDEPQGRKGEPETGNEKRGTPEQKGERGSRKGEPECRKGEQAVPPNHQEPSREPYSEESEFAKPSKATSAPSEKAISFAEWFKTLLPETVQPTGPWKANWAKCYDDLIRLDQRTPGRIAAVCEWARKDGFWSANLLSPLKLRKSDRSGIPYFDVIEARMNAPLRASASPASKPPSELAGVKILSASVS